MMAEIIRKVSEPGAMPWFPHKIVTHCYHAGLSKSGRSFVAGKTVHVRGQFIGSYEHFHTGTMGLDGVAGGNA